MSVQVIAPKALSRGKPQAVKATSSGKKKMTTVVPKDDDPVQFDEKENQLPQNKTGKAKSTDQRPSKTPKSSSTTAEKPTGSLTLRSSSRLHKKHQDQTMNTILSPRRYSTKPQQQYLFNSPKISTPQKTASKPKANKSKVKKSTPKSKVTKSIQPVSSFQNGKFGQIKLIKSPKNHTQFVLKSQLVRSPANPATAAFREVEVLKNLNKLSKSTTPHNFVRMIDYFVQPDLNEPPKFNLDDEAETEINAETQPNTFNMHIVLELASYGSLKEAKNSLSLTEIKSIMFQLLYTLDKAQSHCDFVHNDLHFKNILLSKLSVQDKAHQYQIVHPDTDNQGIFQLPPNARYLIKICDFGLSALYDKEKKKVINNPKYSHLDCPSRDLDTIHGYLSSLNPADWEGQEEVQRPLWKDFKSKFGKQNGLKQLLFHPFFSELRVNH